MLLKQTELDEQKNLAMHIGGASEDMGDACNFCQKHD
jgi:hypothetical protein